MKLTEFHDMDCPARLFVKFFQIKKTTDPLRSGVSKKKIEDFCKT